MNMRLLLLLLFAAVSHAVQPSAEVTEVICDATEAGRSECSVALGGTVSIQLMADASGLHLRCKKNHSTDPASVFTVNKDKVSIAEPWRNRTRFFVRNGTLQLRRAEPSDAGEYVVLMFREDGMLERTKQLHLEVTLHENQSFPLVPVLVASGALLLTVVVVMTTYCLCRKKNHPDSGQRLRSLE